MTKKISKKFKEPECTRLTKLATQSSLTKNPFGENVFLCGKEIQFGWVRTQIGFWKA